MKLNQKLPLALGVAARLATRYGFGWWHAKSLAAPTTDPEELLGGRHPALLQRWMLMLMLMAGMLLMMGPLPAQTSTAPWRYTLIHGATLTDDCPICGRPALVLPLRGTFDLRLIGEDPRAATSCWETGTSSRHFRRWRIWLISGSTRSLS